MKKLTLLVIISISFIHSISYTMGPISSGLLQRTSIVPKTLHAAVPALITAQAKAAQRFQANKPSENTEQNTKLDELDETINALEEQFTSLKDSQKINVLAAKTEKIVDDIKKNKKHIYDNTPGIDMDSRTLLLAVSILAGLHASNPFIGAGVILLSLINFCEGCDKIAKNPDYEKLTELEKTAKNLLKNIQTRQNNNQNN